MKFGETALTFADGKYTLESVTASGTVKVVFSKQKTSDGCGSLIGGAAVGTVFGIAAISVAAGLIVRKKRIK